MADVSKIVAALQQTLEGLGKAQNAAAQAAARAQQMQTQAARTGFRGIAAGMGTVIQRLKRIQEMQNGAATSTKASAEVVQGVTADTNPEEVVSTLMPAVQQFDATTTSMTPIVTEVDAAKTSTFPSPSASYLYRLGAAALLRRVMGGRWEGPLDRWWGFGQALLRVDQGHA